MSSDSKYNSLTKNMNKLNNFDCHSFLDNDTFVIIEISTTSSSQNSEKYYQWLLVHKAQLTVRKLQLKSRDDSATIHERYFDLGYLKFDAQAGVFISQQNNELCPLSNSSCDGIPQVLLQAIENYLQTA